MSWLITGAQKSPVDPLFNNVSLLLHGDGANGSTTIVDSSPSPKTVTTVGSTQISTGIADPFGNATKGVIAFPGTAGSRLTLASNSSLDLGSTFTIEFWAYFNDLASHKPSFLCPDSSPFNGTGRLSFYTEGYGAAQTIRYNFGGVSASSSPDLLSSAVWHHIAFVCNSQVVTVFLDGSSIIGPTFNAAFTHLVQPQRIGELIQYSGYNLDGYLDDFRITKGVARYTSNFTPPTAPFPDA